MSNSTLGAVDPYKLAKRQQSLQGELAVAAMLRAQKLLATKNGMLEYEISFDMDKEGVCAIEGNLRGALEMCCQRCLQTFKRPINVQFMISPVVSDAEAKALPSSYEAVLIQDGVINLLELLEDELILELPLVPMHEDDEICIPAKDNMESMEQELNHPFQILQNLKLKKNGPMAEDE